MIAAADFPRTAGMSLLDRLAQLGVPLIDLTADSRAVKLGSIFVAYPGTAQDGRAFIPEAIARGAAAVIWERRGFEWEERWEIPNLGVEGLRGRISEIAGHIYGNPSEQLLMIGVTGTNGKTSVSQWIAAACESLGRRAAVIGTLGNGLVGERVEARNTTPDAIVLQRLLADYLRRGARVAAMEVSSHGLDQGRAAGIKYDVGVFTNLTRDHLDFHKDFEDYFAAKKILFEGSGTEPPPFAVINADHEYGQKLASYAKSRSQVFTYGIDAGEFRPLQLEVTGKGSRFDVDTAAGKLAIWTPLIGRVNVYNALAAIATGVARGFSGQQIVDGVGALDHVPGRFQRIDEGQPFSVVVDYAHTDDALRNLTQVARDFVTRDGKAGRVITLFGCGGDRDKKKRPLMGEAAGKGSDFVVLTSDNPRSEDPMAIIHDALPGLQATGTVHTIEPDRRLAITLALAQAKPSDIVLIAGKGHEDYQITRAGMQPFADAQVAREALQTLGYGASHPRPVSAK